MENKIMLKRMVNMYLFIQIIIETLAEHNFVKNMGLIIFTLYTLNLA